MLETHEMITDVARWLNVNVATCSLTTGQCQALDVGLVEDFGGLFCWKRKLINAKR